MYHVDEIRYITWQVYCTNKCILSLPGTLKAMNIFGWFVWSWRVSTNDEFGRILSYTCRSFFARCLLPIIHALITLNNCFLIVRIQRWYCFSCGSNLYPSRFQSLHAHKSEKYICYVTDNCTIAIIIIKAKYNIILCKYYVR